GVLGLGQGAPKTRDGHGRNREEERNEQANQCQASEHARWILRGRLNRACRMGASPRFESGRGHRVSLPPSPPAILVETCVRLIREPARGGRAPTPKSPLSVDSFWSI